MLSMWINYPQVIKESEEKLAKLEKKLRSRPTYHTAVRIQMLRLLKTGEARNIKICAKLVGYSEVQLNRWWKLYKEGGISKLLQTKPKGGKVSQLTLEAKAKLEEEMKGGKISRLEDARKYLEEVCGIKYESVNGVWRMLKKFKVKLKTGRRRHRKADSIQQQELKKTLAA